MNQAGHQCSNYSQAQYSAIIARKLGTRHSTARILRFVANVLRKGITIVTALKLFRSTPFAKAPTNHSAETAPANNINKFQILQLNIRKKDMVQHSLLNDENLKDISILAISEPHS